MLHVLNGDAMVPAFTAARLPGDVVVWREMLVEGPAPNGLASNADWDARAAELEAHWGIPRAAHAAGLAEARARLAALRAGEEVVLWFDEDWFCVANALFVLAALAERGHPRVSMAPPADPPHARRTEAYDPAFDARERVAPQRLALARRAWAAYAGDDPRALEALVRDGLAAWPALARGLASHLSRFPSAANGLDAIEQAALDALRDGPLRFGDLFQRVQRDARAAPMGLGDLQLAHALRGLARGPVALVAGVPDAEAPLRGPREGAAAASWRVEATRAGLDVARGARDRLDLADVDRWLGGVRLRGRDVWRWDSDARTLRAPRAA